MKKIKIAIIIFLTICLFDFFIPFPRKGISGLYNFRSGFILSKSVSIKHEIGHKIDNLGGWTSAKDEYQDTVYEMALNLWDNSAEDYASIYSHASGQKEIMPPGLRKFYNWELSEELLKKSENPSCYFCIGEWVFIHFICESVS